jgi:hypothetical protein
LLPPQQLEKWAMAAENRFVRTMATYAAPLRIKHHLSAGPMASADAFGKVKTAMSRGDRIIQTHGLNLKGNGKHNGSYVLARSSQQ